MGDATNAQIDTACAALAAVAALAACEDKANFTNVVTTPVVPAEREWTVAVFLAGDNNLATFGIADIDKMEAAGVDPRVGVVIQAEFSPTDLAEIGCDAACFNRPNFNTFRYVITGQGANVPGPNSPTIDIGNRNMTDPAELREFIQWVKANEPAKRLLVVLWNHGGGYVGLSEDETSAPGHLMLLPDLSAALKNDPVNVLNFDMCLMAGYETLAQIAGHTAFAVVSQETIPGGGNPYTQIIQRLNANPTADAATVAAMVADEYAAFCAGNEQSTTISAFDLGGFSAFENALDQVAVSLRANLSTLFPAITGAAAGAQHFHFSEMKDIVNFLGSLDVRVADPTIHTQLAALRAQTIDPEFLLRNHPSTGTSAGENDVSRSHGLSIVLPSGVGTDVVCSGRFAKFRGVPGAAPERPVDRVPRRFRRAAAGGGLQRRRRPEPGVASNADAPDDQAMRFAIVLGLLLAHEAPCMTVPPSADTVRATIGEIVSSRELVGRVVRVTGRCLDTPNLRPIGPPPLKRSDWQLADDTTAIYVSGSVPTACSDQSLVTIVARVEQAAVSPAAGPRRYLVRLDR